MDLVYTLLVWSITLDPKVRPLVFIFSFNQMAFIYYPQGAGKFSGKEKHLKNLYFYDFIA